jgi:hypothetical protein
MHQEEVSSPTLSKDSVLLTAAIEAQKFVMSLFLWYPQRVRRIMKTCCALIDNFCEMDLIYND